MTSPITISNAKRRGSRSESPVTTSGTTLTEIFGVGDVIAATLLGHTGDVTRFASRGEVRRLQRDGTD